MAKDLDKVVAVPICWAKVKVVGLLDWELSRVVTVSHPSSGWQEGNCWEMTWLVKLDILAV